MTVPDSEANHAPFKIPTEEISRRLRVKTAVGEFVIQLMSDHAPITCQYFHQLAQKSTLNDTGIFRIVSPRNTEDIYPGPGIQVIQIGTQEDMSHERDLVAHESTSLTGLTHRQWTVSAARFDVGELYRSFFICMRDEPSLDFGGERSPDGLGFAAFGEVSEGFDTLISAFALAEDTELLTQHIAVHSIEPCA